MAAHDGGRPRQVLLYNMCILSVHALLQVVGYYDFSVLFMSDGFPKKFGWGWVGGWVGVSSIQVFFGFLEFF